MLKYIFFILILGIVCIVTIIPFSSHWTIKDNTDNLIVETSALRFSFPNTGSDRTLGMLLNSSLVCMHLRPDLPPIIINACEPIKSKLDDHKQHDDAINRKHGFPFKDFIKYSGGKPMGIADIGTYTSPSFPSLRLSINKLFNTYYEIDTGLINVVKSFIGKNRVLGVHIRSAIKFKLKPDESHFTIYIEETKKQMKQNKFDKIFVATHMQGAIDVMIKTFGKDKIIYHAEIERQNSLNDWNQKTSIKQTRGIILDVYALSLCNFLICGPSNVVYMAMYINPTVGFVIPAQLKVDTL